MQGLYSPIQGAIKLRLEWSTRQGRTGEFLPNARLDVNSSVELFRISAVELKRRDCVERQSRCD